MTTAIASPPSNASAPRICVGIATRGRPEQLACMLRNLARQTLAPSAVIVCGSEPADVGALAEQEGLTLIYAQPPGTSRQRNSVLDALPEGTEYVAFFDDDFYPHPDWLQSVGDAFRADPCLDSCTGHVLADGILGPGLTRDEALARIAAHDPASTDWVVEDYSPYGCNMAFRCDAVRDLRFDERLVLYGWLEDRDFGAAIARRGGRLIKLGRAVGVHLGIKRGRTPGRKFGYSQVMNPVYMHRKSTMTTRQAVAQVTRNLAANLVKSARPEPYIDRRGRLTGNLIAALDLLRLRLTPERAASL